MKVVVATDSFKGSMTSLEAGAAIAEGIRRVKDAEVFVSPIADGGEGTVESLVLGMKGTYRRSMVTGPLGRQTEAVWGILSENGTKTAIIEMAAAAGIILLKQEELNPLYTTTYGVGELIREAIAAGCRRFIIGIGGSATNDGGVGMLQALGFRFMDEKGMPIPRGAAGLSGLASIDTSGALPELSECMFRVACDVKNPLCGPLGCSAVFGPQKGATTEMIEQMDAWLAAYAKLSGGDSDAPGTGAAGGMGFAFQTFLHGELTPGIEIILEETGLEQSLLDADVVITGEGRMDAQTVMGKVPVGVARLAKKHGKRVLAFCGCATPDAGVCNEHGIDAFFPILRQVGTLSEALCKENATRNLADTVEQVFRLI